MATKQLEAQVRHVPGAAIIDLDGDINAFAEEALKAAYDEAEAYDTSSVVLNFSHVEYINSTGIALIVGLLAQARKSHRRLLIYGLSEHYLEIFKITRLADFMDVLTDESSALASVRAVSSV
jgi:anti-anti-sigma factor